jgi:hypothetical protein
MPHWASTKPSEKGDWSPFDANSGDGGDHAAHLAKLQSRSIDARSDISEADLRRQFDMMMSEAAAIQRTGNSPPSDATMIAFYDNALPIAYTTMRQHARRANHKTLLAHHMDIMSQVRAEVNSRAPAAPPDEGVVNVDTDPKDGPRSLEDVEAGVDCRLRHAPRREEGGEEGSPFPTSLFEAIKGSPQLTHQRVPVLVEGEQVRGRAHVKWHVGVKETLQVGLSDVNGREIIIPSRSEQKDETDRGRLSNHCGEFPHWGIK